MRMEDSGPLYARIGRILFEKFGPFEHNALLYADIDEIGSVGLSFNEDRGDYIFSHGFAEGVADQIEKALIDLWKVAPKNQRWVEMSYEINGSKFHAELYYPDDLDPAEQWWDRNARRISQILGDKPFRCDPWPDTPDSYTFDL